MATLNSTIAVSLGIFAAFAARAAATATPDRVWGT
jgi:hypothetical protein